MKCLHYLLIIFGVPIFAVLAADCYFYTFLMVARFKPTQDAWLIVKILNDRPAIWALLYFFWLIILFAAALSLPEKQDEDK